MIPELNIYACGVWLRLVLLPNLHTMKFSLEMKKSSRGFKKVKLWISINIHSENFKSFQVKVCNLDIKKKKKNYFIGIPKFENTMIYMPIDCLNTLKKYSI